MTMTRGVQSNDYRWQRTSWGGPNTALPPFANQTSNDIDKGEPRA